MLHTSPMANVSAPHGTVPDQFNVTTAFLDRHIAEGRGAKIAVYSEGATSTYAQIADLANRVGNGLLNLGIDLEQRVALLLLDSTQFAAAFFGTIKIGSVVVPINTVLRPDDYVYLLNDSRARALFIHASIWQTIQHVRPQLKYLRHVIVVGLSEPETSILHDFEKFVSKASSSLQAAETHKDDSALWLYSSGSTGFPKGCVHLQHDMLYCTEYYAKSVLGITENDITFSAAKLYFAYGLGNGLYFPFGVGASTVLYPGRPLAEDMFKVVEQYRPTIFFGVPTLYGSMLALPDVGKRFDFSSVRICVSAGEALPAPIWHAWKARTGLDIIDGIGSTENYHIFLSNRPDDIRPGSSGKPFDGYELKIIGEDGRAVPRGEIGNLLVKGETAALFYLHQYGKSQQTFLGEWLATGDKYFVDEDGYYWHAGRTDDMLIIRGVNVFPSQVEAALVGVPLLSPHHQLLVTRVNRLDELEVRVEVAAAFYREVGAPAFAQDSMSGMKMDHAKYSMAPVNTAAPQLPLITGAIRDQMGTPIAGASVQAGAASVVTDAAGTFAVESAATSVVIRCAFCRSTAARVGSDGTVTAIVQRYQAPAQEQHHRSLASSKAHPLPG